tara:strand:+ start:237 stop:449 length:213 start_codon:yes stop_codon:yes gene_type:complete
MKVPIDNWDIAMLICEDVFEKIFPGRSISDEVDPEFAQLFDDVRQSMLELLVTHRVHKDGFIYGVNTHVK